MPLDSNAETLLRELTPQVLGAVMRRFGDFAAAEDAVQEALIAAAMQWPVAGLPDNPRGWLIQVAARRMTDHLRSETARRRREAFVARPEAVEPPSLADIERDDTLILLFMCCHSALTPPSAIALTLRAVGGLTTTEIANAFLVPETTMAQRISRAKQSIKASGVPFRPGLLALMLLTDARRPARTGPDGELIPLSEQDRTLWDRQAIDEGIALITATLSRGSVGPYQLQAAIAAVHDEAARTDDTDWLQILALYGLLKRMSDNPMVALNHAIAVAMVNGPRAGLDLLDRLDADGRLAGHYRMDAVRAHLFEMSGDHPTAIAHYRAAASRTTSIPERDYLDTKAARLSEGLGRR